MKYLSRESVMPINAINSCFCSDVQCQSEAYQAVWVPDTDFHGELQVA